MDNGRLEPLEALEKDYYLDERNGWYSDGEQRDSESSDDELREQLRELAGLQCQSRKQKQRGKVKKLDKFESDMDIELSENFVAHASRIFSLKKNGNSENLESVFLSLLCHFKSVTFENQLNKPECSSKSFDNDSNLLYKALNKISKEERNEAVEFYDSDEDEDNERWVHHHREQLKIVKSLNSSSEEDRRTKQEKDQNHETDAVLSCPACMSLLTRDCQRHELYLNQYRAVFVENCSVVQNEVLFLPRSGKDKQKARKNAAGVKPNTVVDPANITTLPKEDLFHPVLCSVCATNVGVYDYEAIFHFFNVLTGYA
uniref:E2F-associated phosphoprotein n=1 Tax=Elaeophora elaphi TaxID=1147741 RepID=A0A0R3RG21_9BILA